MLQQTVLLKMMSTSDTCDTKTGDSEFENDTVSVKSCHNFVMYVANP